MIRKIAIVTSVLYLSGCATVNGQDVSNKMDNQQLIKTVATIVVIGAIAGSLGKQNQKSKCDNNRAGFWVDNATGRTYTCP